MSLYNQLHTVIFHVIAKSSVYRTFRLFVRCSGRFYTKNGSRYKCIQDKLIASHDLDAPWKPADMEQRCGRMVRQGNENKKVHLYRYVTEGTFDAYLYQTLKNKQKFISQIMTSKSPVRSCQHGNQFLITICNKESKSSKQSSIMLDIGFFDSDSDL